MSLASRLLLLCLSLQSPLQALEAIQLQIDSLQYHAFQARDIRLEFVPTSADSYVFTLDIASLAGDMDSNGLRVSLSCADTRFDWQVLQCARGELQLTSTSLETMHANLELDLDLESGAVDFLFTVRDEKGNIDAHYRSAGDRSWEFTCRAERLGVGFVSTFLQPLVDAFSVYRPGAGTVNLEARLHGSGSDMQGVMLKTEFHGLSVEGPSVLEKVDLSLALDAAAHNANWKIANTISVTGGEMYLQPGIELLGDSPGFYLALSASPLTLSFTGNWLRTEDLLEVSSFYYQHPGVLEIGASGRLALAGATTAPDLDIEITIPSLASSYPVYLQPVLLKTNFNDLEISGALALDLDYRDSAQLSLDLLLDEVYLDDSNGRFSISELNSRLRLDSNNEPVISTIDWAGMSFYRLDLGAGDIVFESRGRDVRVLDWQDVDILDGTLKIDELDIRNIADPGFSFSLGGKLTPISMQALTQVLGWTVFPGQLSGEISGLKYTKNTLYLDGDILVSLFGGEVRIEDFKVQDVFSPLSVLTTNISIEKLDLEQLTDVFTFGKIEGSLSGYMRNLRLEDWQPSYFDAELATPVDDDKPHRISQKALENLNELGGGLGGTLSNGFLRFLPVYSYGRLGISCRLVHGVCELGGVEDNGDSFSILTRGGWLPPWVEVRGTGRAIKWKELIEGLKQISEGEVEID